MSSPVLAPALTDPITPLAALHAAMLAALVAALLPGALSVFVTVALWWVLHRAGQPGWAALLPVYCAVVLLRAGGRSGMWAWLLATPAAMVVVELLYPTVLLTVLGDVLLIASAVVAALTLSILIGTGVATVFGYSTVFGVVALGLVGFLGYPILAFGHAPYRDGRLAAGLDARDAAHRAAVSG
jgi:hypothetical protein